MREARTARGSVPAKVAPHAVVAARTLGDVAQARELVEALATLVDQLTADASELELANAALEVRERELKAEVRSLELARALAAPQIEALRAVVDGPRQVDADAARRQNKRYLVITVVTSVATMVLGLGIGRFLS